MKDLMQIGDVAEEAGVNIQTLRYYEKRGIIAPAKRKESGFRLYHHDTVKTLNFIKHAKELGFTLAEIKELLDLRATSVSRCTRVRNKAKVKLSDIQSKLKLLRQMERNLKGLIDKCEKQQTDASCPIIEGIEK